MTLMMYFKVIFDSHKFIREKSYLHFYQFNKSLLIKKSKYAAKKQNLKKVLKLYLNEIYNSQNGSKHNKSHIKFLL